MFFDADGEGVVKLLRKDCNPPRKVIILGGSCKTRGREPVRFEETGVPRTTLSPSPPHQKHWRFSSVVEFNHNHSSHVHHPQSLRLQ